MLHIYVDADACPVKEEIYRVARRHDLHVTIVANSWMRTPKENKITLQLVKGDFDAADDWIAENAEKGDVVITSDIPLAARCVENGAAVLGVTGKPLDENNIGPALASRNLLSELRDTGLITGGPPPLQKKDRSRFLQKLDETIRKIRRTNPE